LISNRHDPLCFAASRHLLVNTIEQLICTSWGEVLAFRHVGAEGFMDSLVKYLRLTIGEDINTPPTQVESYCFSVGHGHTIARRVQDVFAFIAHIYGPDGPGPNSRYILPLGQSFAMISKGDKGYGWKLFRGYTEVLEALAEPMDGFSPIVPDPEAFTDTPLPTLCAKREPGLLQLFFYLHGGAADIYVMDENGSLYLQHFSDADPRYLLDRQHRFLTSIQQRQSLTSTESMEHLLHEPPRYFQLKQDNQKQWHCSPVLLPTSLYDDDIVQLRLMGSPEDSKEDGAVLICGDREFSFIEYGQQLYVEVARHIMSLRKGQHSYTIYLTGVEPFSIKESDEWRTLRLLQYKNRIELELNSALKSLALGNR
jgi:adenylate cyclase class 1